MGFWDMDDGTSAVSDKTEYDAGGGNFDPIPDGSKVLAWIERVKWSEDKDQNRYIELQWRVEKPEEFENRIVFQKLWTLDFDPTAKDAEKAKKKRNKALLLFAAIDANCGGKLGRKAGIPTDDDMALALQTRKMVIRLAIWEMGDATGNWVSAVYPKDHEVKAGEVKEGAKKSSGSIAQDIDDDVPF